MLTRTQKEVEVEALRSRFGRANGVIVADYRGIDVESVNELRGRLKSEGGEDFEYRVTKNALLRIAVEGTDAAGLAEQFAGPTAVAFSYGDPAQLAKILVEFAKAHEIFEIKGGLFEGKPVESEVIGTLATLPSLDEIRGTIVGLVQAPATKIARVLAVPATQLARLLDARRETLSESGNAS